MSIFTGTLAQFLAGQTVLNAPLGGWHDVLAAVSDPWTMYSPVWAASTTNPTNYAISGLYAQVGKTFFGLVSIVITGSTTAGSGNYSVTMPPGIVLFTGAAWEALGTMSFRDTSAGTLYGFNAISVSSTTIGAASNATRWSASSPAVVASGDTLALSFMGQTA